MTEAGAPTVITGVPADVDALSEALPDGLIVADDQGILRFANSRASRVLGIDLASRFGQPLAVALPLRDSEGRSWWEMADPWRSIHLVKGHREKLLWTEDGVEILLTAKYVREGRRGPVRRVLMSVRDASARQRAEQDHAALISTIAHELRSPLTSVKGYSNTLLRKWDRFTDDQKRFMIETIEADADRVTRLITELLDVSRIDAGRLDIRAQPVDLEKMAQQHADRFEATGALGDRELVIDADPDLPEVWADPDKLQQIFGNLLENALRHGAGTIQVGIRSHPEPIETERAAIAVTVSDDGEGVPQAHLPLIFNRFWHGQKRGSTGLGLYIVKGLVEAHGGRISVGRAASGGAEFRFTLPSGVPDYAS
ncbi:MAG: ATP-binding protein [Lapillicoccus sp.]